MIVASLCTIPIRKDTFRKVAQRILYEQSQPIDRLHVWLNGYKNVDADLLQDPRLEYHQEPQNPGPSVRYRVADGLSEGDILVTLDDDLVYPNDYISRGVSELTTGGPATVVSYGGIRWDALSKSYLYGSERYHYAFDDGLSTHCRIALLMGGVSFFWAEMVKTATSNLLSGFRTNDDMMISHRLGKRQVRLLCCPKPANWIRATETAEAWHALFKLDAPTRHKTFRQMVQNLRFDPTAGQLAQFMDKKARLLILADICPPLPGSEALDKHLRSLCSEESGVHLIAPVTSSAVARVQRHVDIPYHVHSVLVPDAGGRLDSFAPVRYWRESRIRRSSQRLFFERADAAMQKLQPTRVLWFGHSVPEWLIRLFPNAAPFHLD